ncbi:enoyl-CoA hydratase [Thiomonas sp. X19]|uniref:enoyl-CoA hydratase n=1 Tax=Thiomonas sp. X19 TaxID=1050370 RepID=UPI000DDA5B2F|nr:enoyl-CoA hydratase [Thiomonas sp. X19]
MSEILAYLEHGVLSLTFNRVEKKNALTSAMYAALADQLEQAAGDVQTRVLVIQGQESLFTAGNDVSEFLQRPPASMEAPVFRFLRAIADFPKPALAAVCGPAVGIGTTLLLHCDLVYAGDNALFSLPFVNLGLCPEAASSLLLPLRIGHAAANEKLLFGEPFTADEAQELGLVNRVLPPSEVNVFALQQARKLAAKPLASLMVTKTLLRQPQRAAVHAMITEEAAHFERLLKGPAAKEAFGAFLAKRKPDFSGL